MKQTIKKRILMLCISISLVLTVILASVAIIFQRNAIMDQFHTVGEVQLRNGENYFNSESEFIAEHLDLMVNNDTLFLYRYTQGVTKPYISDEAYAFMDNMEVGKLYINPMVQNFDETYVTVFAYKKVKETKEVVNVGEVDSEYFSIFYDTVTNAISEHDVGYIVREDGTVLLSSDAEFMKANGNLNDLNDKFGSFIGGMSVEEMSAEKIRFNDVTYYVTGKEITPNEVNSERLFVIYATDYSNITNAFIKSCSSIILCAAVVIVIGAIIAIRNASVISNPIVDATQQIELMADGNLTDRMGSYRTNDETARITDALRSTIDSLNMYVSEISRVASNIADYDLSSDLDDNITFKGAFEAIKVSLSDIIRSLRDVIKGIEHTCIQVDNSARQVANGAQMLAESASKEAAAIDEMNEMNASMSKLISKNNASAIETRNFSENVLSKITDSVAALDEMAGSMRAIEESSNEISHIIKVISDIAFQTNILALNASVEAAKAGTYGKGFSVVADEVKNLANRSAEAAKQTEALILRSTEAVRDGSDRMGAVSQSFTEIAENVDSMNTMIDNIADNCGEQEKSIRFIETKLENITNAVQSNSATAEESAAASEQLSAQASQLKNAVEKFRL
ncbi:MAG: hypothetical protein IJ446_11630 [Oscillospiraceae bacterium]|nr:hypothetical protein [Oscillospiraceae bacterium]